MEVLIRDEFTCKRCLRTLPEYALEVDHIIPLSELGPDNAANKQTLCVPCHQRKTAEEVINRSVY